VTLRFKRKKLPLIAVREVYEYEKKKMKIFNKNKFRKISSGQSPIPQNRLFSQKIVIPQKLIPH